MKVFLFSALIFVSSLTYSQTISFDMFIFGDKIGVMTITRSLRSDSSELYVLETKSKAKILWVNRENHTRYEVVYKGGKLISSYAKEVENGEVKTLTKVSLVNGKYEAEHNGTKKTFVQAPTNSVVTLFFKAPAGQSTIFYEYMAEFNKLENTDPNTWQFKSGDGHTNVYHYVNGKIHHLEFHVSIATVKLVRQGG